MTGNSRMRFFFFFFFISVVQDSEEKELSSFIVQALQPAVCLVCFQEFLYSDDSAVTNTVDNVNCLWYFFPLFVFYLTQN